jgi:hypothetical protein
MQIAIIIIVVALSIAYAVYRLHQAIQGANDPCYGCKGCALREQMRQKQHKKQEKPSCYQKK